jgi:hypothetical protein
MRLTIVTFTVKIALQPFEVAFEAGSIAEAVAILTEPDNELSKLAALANGTAMEDAAEDEPAATDAPKAKRGRKSKQTVEAVAPPPMPVPDAAPPAPAPAPVPAETATLAPPPPVVAAPPPPAPVAPAPVAATPPGVLAPKVVAELNRRKEGQPDNGAGLIAWLAGAGLVVPTATWDEALLCIQFLDDAKLGPVAQGLQIA